MDYRLAIDIGATSGRLVLGWKNEAGEMEMEVIHRFRTPLIDDGNNHCHWDVTALFEDILIGLAKCKVLGKIPTKIGIDTFGVDYALLDENDQRIGEVVSYRDERTVRAKKDFLTPERLFGYTGIAPQAFNTCYQLYCDKISGKLENAKTIIMLPSYLCYLLTGVKTNELSILSTGALLTPGGFRFSKSVLNVLGLNESSFAPLVSAGTKIGSLTNEIAKRVGYTCDVYATLEHDTGAAFLGSTASKDDILLSSGTWSLLGTIIEDPIATDEAYQKGFTNELSRPGEIRFLQNIMGMWLISRLQDELHDRLITEVTAMAEKGRSYQATFDASDESLMNPSSMKKAICTLLKEGGNEPPETKEELYFCVYHSLAKAYAKAIKGLESITKREFKTLCVFGGGVKAEILNELTAAETGLTLKKGPSEATAIGNLMALGD